MIGIHVSEIMRKGVITAKKTDTVQKAAGMMKKSKIGRVVVIDKGKIIGILTDSDIIDVVSKGMPLKTPISKAMNYPVKTITPETDIEDAIKTINKYNIGGLPVTERGKLVGIVTERDLVKAEPGLLDLMREKENLEHVSPSEKELMISGECDECKNYSENLRLVEGRFLCEDCR
jgi:predicted transcriptional regulator